MIRSLLKAFLSGILFGLGFCLVLGLALFAYKANLFDRAVNIVSASGKSKQALEVAPYDDKDIPSNSYMNLGRLQQVPIPSGYALYNVSDTAELWKAIRAVKKESGNAAIILSDGVYMLDRTLNIDAPNVMLMSKSGNPQRVILKGRGMHKTPNVENIIRVSASGFVLDGITLKDTGNHLIQIAAEQNADLPVVRNCILQDSYEQLFKVSYNKKRPESFSDSGLVEYCMFEYTQGIGPNDYIGGIDAHGIRNWTIRNNVFKDIASPAKNVAEYAIHIWSNSSNNVVQGNVIIDSDRGIGFGLNERGVRYSNLAGLIKGNIIYHSDNKDKFADTGIALENSPKSIIEDNWIYLADDYPRAIEYRFPATNHVIIKNNHTNKSISSRDGGQAKLINNIDKLELIDFLVKLNGRLREIGEYKFSRQ